MITPLLVISTSFKIQTVAIFDNDKIYVSRKDSKMDHLSLITILLDEVISSSGLSKDKIKSVLVDIGPGSFTGIRIGVTAARTIAQALNIPIAPVSSLESLSVANGILKDWVVLCLKDGGKQRVYISSWRFEERGPFNLLPFQDITFEQLKENVLPKLRFVEQPVLFTSDNGSLIEEICSPFMKDGDIISFIDAPTPQDMINAAQIFKVNFVSWEKILPLYIRKSDAEIKRENKNE